MTDYLVRIRVDGDASSAEASFRRASAAANDLTAATSKTRAASTASAEASRQLAAATDKATAGSGKGSAALLAFTKAADAAKGGTFGLGKTIANVAFAFGPWGMAIGVVSQALIGLFENMSNAEREAAKFRRELENQRYAAEAAASALRNKKFHDDTYASNLRRVTEAQRQEIWATEDAIAAANGYGESTEDLSIKLLRLRASALQAEAGVSDLGATLEENTKRATELLEQAAALERQADLMQTTADAAASTRTATRVTVGGRRPGGGARQGGGVDPAFAAGLVEARNAQRLSDPLMERGDGGEFAAEMAAFRRSQAMSGMERGGERAGSIESMRAEIDTMREVEEIRANSAVARAEQHEQEMQQLAEKQAAYMQHAAVAGQMASSILSISDARRQARNAALAQGKTDKQAAREGKIAALEQTAAALTGLRNLAIQKAIEQTALGLGALAVYNYPSAGLHFAAAGTWAAVGVGAGLGARAVGAQASSMRQASGGSANGTAGYGGSAGGSSGSSGGGSSSASPIPGSPGPSVPSTSGGGGRDRPAGRTVVINGDVHTYGTPHRDFLRMVDEGLAVEVGNSRRRRAGGE